MTRIKMQDEHRTRLQFYREAILDDLEYRDIADHLIAKSTITDDDNERIVAGITRKDRVREFLRLLPKRGPEAFPAFVESLKKPYLHLWKLLSRPLDDEQSDAIDVRESRVDIILRAGKVPPRPTGFTDRPEETKKLRTALYKLQHNDGWVILHGMGGSGKTILAAESLRDPTLLRQCFPSGVFWVTIGQVSDSHGRVDQSKLLTKMANLCMRIDEDQRPRPTNIEEAHDRLLEILMYQYPRVLLVLDDVWSQVVSRWFAVGCRVLVTTRDRTVTDQARIGENKRMFVSLDGGLKVAEARCILSSWTGIPVNELPKEANSIIAECESSPLAIAMIGALLQKDPKQSKWEYYYHNLRDRKLKRINRPIEYEYPALDASIAVSIEALDEDQRMRYTQLAVFEDDVVMSSEVLSVLWNDEPIVIEQEYMKDFVNKSLVRLVPEASKEHASYLIHDLQLDYLKEIGNTKEELRTAHAQFVDSYSAKCEDDFSQLPDDGYVHQHLILHLLKAKRVDDAAQLLADLQWIESKLRVCGPSAVIVDYLRYQSAVTDKEKGRKHSRGAAKPQRSLSSQAVKLNDFQRFVSTNAHLFFDPNNFPDMTQLALQQPHKSEVYQQGLALARAQLAVDSDHFYVDWINERSATEWHLLTMKVGEDPVRYAAFSLDKESSKIVMCSENLAVEVRMSESGSTTVRFEQHSDFPHHASFSPNGVHLASCSDDGAIKVWMISGSNAHELFQLSGHKPGNATRCCEFSPDGKHIASCSEDGSVKVWSSLTGNEVFTCHPPHCRSVLSCRYSHDGKMIASASEDRTLKIWSAASGDLITSRDQHDGNVNDCSFSPDGTLIISASDDATVKVWKTGPQENPDAVVVLKKPGRQQTLYPFLCCAFSPDGNIIAAGGADADIDLWDADTYCHIDTLTGHTSFVFSCNFSVDSSRLVSSSDDGTVKVWNMAHQEKLVSDGKPLVSRRFDIIFGNSDVSKHTVYAIDMSDSKMKVLSGDCVKEMVVTNRVKSWRLSSKGDKLALGFMNGSVEVHSLEDECDPLVLQRHMKKVRHCLFSSDDTHLISCSDDGSHTLWDLVHGIEFGHLQAGEEAQDRISSRRGSSVSTIATDTKTSNLPCAFFNNSVLAVSGSLDGNVYIWPSADGAMLHTCKGHGDTVVAVAVSHDDQFVASASVDRSMMVWLASNGESVHKLSGHLDVVRTCAFSPKGSYLASGSDDRSIKVWDLKQGKEVACARGHEGWTVSIQFSPDEKSIVCIDKNSVRWWSVDGRPLQTYYMRGQFPKFLRVNRDFSTFVTVDDIGYLYVLQRLQVD